MKNKKYGILIIIGIIIAITVFLLIKSNGTTNNDSTNNNEVTTNKKIEITPEISKLIKKLNEVLDMYYMNTFDANDIYISSYSYLMTVSGKEILINDLETADYEVPEELKNTTIHFVKPRSLKPYLDDKISDEDLEILTVYTAIPTNDGVFISSNFDEGGIISDEQYKQFILDNSWAKGEVKAVEKDTPEYNAITKSIVESAPLLKDGNIKHIVANDKYVVVVISQKSDPAIIKQYALQKQEDSTYSILFDNLSSVDAIKYINYNYTDFDLGILPLYKLSEFDDISSDLTKTVAQLIDNGDVDAKDKITYKCTAGNFSYIEFGSNLKLLLHLNNNSELDLFEVDNFKTALSKMLELSENPPAFILNFDN